VRAGTPLLELGDPGDLEVVVDLLSSDAVKVEPGDAALIEEWGGGKVLNAMVRRIEPFGFTKISALGIEEQRVNVILDFIDPPTELSPLGHGYRIEARIVIWEAADVLKIPMSALFRARDEWAVFVEKGGRARLRIVSAGRINSLEAQVLEGLEEGERVVLYPSDRVQENTRIAQR
jgi:HlyD family secretion protein